MILLPEAWSPLSSQTWWMSDPCLLCSIVIVQGLRNVHARFVHVPLLRGKAGRTDQRLQIAAEGCCCCCLQLTKALQGPHCCWYLLRRWTKASAAIAVPIFCSGGRRPKIIHGCQKLVRLSQAMTVRDAKVGFEDIDSRESVE